jgi:hypothetical protein
MNLRYTKHVSGSRLATLPGMILLLLVCASVIQQALSQQDRSPVATQPVDSRDEGRGPLPSEIVGQAPLFPGGTLRKVSTFDILPQEIRPALYRYWPIRDQREYVLPLSRPRRYEYDLIYEDSCRKAWITQIVDLRWKVEIRTPEQAAQFADLIGAAPAGIFFRDARGMEVGILELPPHDQAFYYEVDRADFERLGVKERRIQQVASGFIIRRPLYQPKKDGTPARLMESREFVAPDGLYIFGVDREILRGKECSVVHDFRDEERDAFATSHYRALFGAPDE